MQYSDPSQITAENSSRLRPKLLDFGDLLDKESRHFSALTEPPSTSQAGGLESPDKPQKAPSLETKEKKQFGIAANLNSREPWVQFTTEDFFGLALSGGGIRSAVFNLGLLQSLGERGILKRVQYLSTVSGGGYIGGFWTNWLRRQRKEPAGTKRGVFPSPGGEDKNHFDPREPDEIRHLREYSRFIIPRVGAAQFETWNAIITILGGMLPSIITSLCLIGFIFESAHVLTRFLKPDASHIYRSPLVFAGFSLVVHSFFLVRWSITDRLKNLSTRWIPLMTVPLCTAAWYGLQTRIHDSFWTWHVFSTGVEINARPLAPGLAFLAAGVILMGIRPFASDSTEKPYMSSWSPSLDRATALCLAPGLGAILFAAIWECGRYLGSAQSEKHIPIAAFATTVLGGFLFGLRNWLTKRITDTSSGSFGRSLMVNLKPYLPQLLSTGIVLGLVVTAVLIVQTPLVDTNPKIALGLMGLVLISAVLFFNPHNVGMHDFYRRRIRDCFLGASWAGTGKETNGNENDPTLGALRNEAMTTNSSPFHLICCTANNLAGDPLINLYRGARSAVISPYGISLGGQTASLDNLRLSSALTASAAAFNTQMGQLSIDWGPAVAYAMGTFNLRLGLWVPHPGNSFPFLFSVLPGLGFFYELLGNTHCDPDNPDVARGSLISDYPNIHLSDGGHFENLALYELVRRHCRYIIVSDCGADEDIKFDDLANAIRRVREDFGVQIEIDVSPLRPGSDGFSRQHAVVGTIHYDTLTGMDKGTLLYIKPTLTGDEPADVLQHHNRYPHFPHDSTAEQLYNEAQWESYRNLGEHVGRTVFAFHETNRPNDSRFVENLFLDAGETWRPALPRQDEIYSELTNRCSQVETDIRKHGPLSLKLEFFPEIESATYAPPSPADRATLAGSRSPTELAQIAYFLMPVIQIMEDVWVAADLDRNWSHPMVRGWMSYFQRWTSTPSFRTLWPILRPMYNPSFREFAKTKFNLNVVDETARPSDKGLTGAMMTLQTQLATRAHPDGLAARQWQLLRGNPPPLASRQAMSYWLTFSGDPTNLDPVQVALLLFDAEMAGPKFVVRWHCDDFFVPPALSGAGFTGRFLDRVIAQLRTDGVNEIHVTISRKASQKLPNRAARWALVEAINFYKSRGFVYVTEPPVTAEGEAQETTLVLRLQAPLSSNKPGL